MSIATAVTRGFGSFGTVNLAVSSGFSVGVPFVDTYMTYESSNALLKTVVDGVDVAQQNSDGSFEAMGQHTTHGLSITNSGKIQNTTEISADYTVLASDDIIECDTTNGTFTLYLPTLADGTHYKITNIGLNGYNVNVTPFGTEELFRDNSMEPLHDLEVFDLNGTVNGGWL